MGRRTTASTWQILRICKLSKCSVDPADAEEAPVGANIFIRLRKHYTKI